MPSSHNERYKIRSMSDIEWNNNKVGIRKVEDVKGMGSLEQVDSTSLPSFSSTAELCERKVKGEGITEDAECGKSKTSQKSKDTECDSREESVWRKYAGILLTLAASLLFSSGVSFICIKIRYNAECFAFYIFTNSY